MVLGRSHSIKDHPGFTGLMVLSALSGALAAMFTTPRTGYEVRTRLKERGRRIKSRWQEYMSDDTEADMGDLATQAKSRAATTTEKVKQDTAQTAKTAKDVAKAAVKRDSKEEGEP